MRRVTKVKNLSKIDHSIKYILMQFYFLDSLSLYEVNKNNIFHSLEQEMKKNGLKAVFKKIEICNMCIY